MCMSFNWKKVLATTGILVVGAVIAVLKRKDSDDFTDWLESASDDELSDGYEQRRQEWMKTGFGVDGEKTPEMKQINREMSRRSAEKWENDPNRNRDPYFRWTDANRWDKD